MGGRKRKTTDGVAEGEEDEIITGEATDIGPGWTFKQVPRKNGSGQKDKYWFSPSKRKFRSKAAIKRFLEEEGGQEEEADDADERTESEEESGSEGEEEEGGGEPSPKRKRKTIAKKTPDKKKKTPAKKTPAKKTPGGSSAKKKAKASDDKHPRPKGRARKGMAWDGEKGEWVPQEDQDEDEGGAEAGAEEAEATPKKTPKKSPAGKGKGKADKATKAAKTLAKKTSSAKKGKGKGKGKPDENSVRSLIAGLSPQETEAILRSVAESSPEAVCTAAATLDPDRIGRVREAESAVWDNWKAARTLDFDARPRPSRSGDPGRVISVDDDFYGPHGGHHPQMKYRVMLILREWRYELRETREEKVKLAEGAVRIACYDLGYPSPQGTFPVDRWFRQFREGLRTVIKPKPPRRKRGPYKKRAPKKKKEEEEKNGGKEEGEGKTAQEGAEGASSSPVAPKMPPDEAKAAKDEEGGGKSSAMEEGETAQAKEEDEGAAEGRVHEAEGAPSAVAAPAAKGEEGANEGAVEEEERKHDDDGHVDDEAAVEAVGVSEEDAGGAEEEGGHVEDEDDIDDGEDEDEDDDEELDDEDEDVEMQQHEAEVMEKFLEMHHGIVQEYGEFLCTEKGGLAEGLVRDCERRWNRAFVSSFLTLKGDRGWDDLGMSADCQDYALNMIVSHMIRAEMYGEARDLLTDDKFARGRLSLLGCEAGTRRHVRDSEELCRMMRARAADGGGAGAGAAGGLLEGRKTLAQSYAKFSAIIGAEVQRNQGANDAESSLTACRALDRIGLSFVRNKCWREAIGLYEATVKFLKSAGHDDSELVAVMLFNVGTAYFELDEYESSFKAYGNCVKVREKTLGENNATFLRTLHRMGDALADSWKLEPALQCYDKAVLAMRLNPSMERKMLGNVLMSKGRVKFKRGELQEAAQCGEESLRGKRAEFGSNNEALSREYAFLSDVCAERGDVEEAKRHLDEAIRLKRSTAADSDSGDMLLFKGSRHRLNKEYDDCLLYYCKALDSLKSGQGFRKCEVADMSHMVALAYALKGEYVSAVKNFEESLRSRRTRSRKSDLDIARTLFEMGLCHKKLEKYDKALKCIDESFSIRKNQLGDCEMVMLTLKEIGTVHLAMKEYEKAGSFYDDALQMCHKMLDSDHEHCATILHEQGVLKSEISGKEEAIKCFDKSLEIRRQRFGADHPCVGETLHMMGCVLVGQSNKYETAEYCLQESLRIRKACLGDDDQQVADTLHMLGTLQEQIGKSDNAIQLLNDSLRIRRLGTNQGMIAKSLNDLGTVYRLKQQYDLAIECFEESLGIFLQDLDNNKENILSAYIALGDSEAALGRSRGACTHYEQALDIMMQMPSNTPERIPRLLQKIGILEHKVGEMDKAKNHLLGYILLWKESGMDDDIDYVNALHIVGTIHRANGEEEKAHDCWAEAYQTYHDKGLAAKNPHLGGELKKLLQEIARDSGAFKNSIFSKFRDGLSDETA